ncbi:phosphate acyltransferase [Striga asiatica]|uniref:Phosphate acyltransferase n=1 Tax=Striga asiatica TaxID=4170 RepID=A0A5A7PZG2_STRAF|nr:phosphate acyltransferase [Striga asiatica]
MVEALAMPQRGLQLHEVARRLGAPKKASYFKRTRRGNNHPRVGRLKYGSTSTDADGKHSSAPESNLSWSWSSSPEKPDPEGLTTATLLVFIESPLSPLPGRKVSLLVFFPEMPVSAFFLTTTLKKLRTLSLKT